MNSNQRPESTKVYDSKKCKICKVLGSLFNGTFLIPCNYCLLCHYGQTVTSLSSNAPDLYILKFLKWRLHRRDDTESSLCVSKIYYIAYKYLYSYIAPISSFPHSVNENSYLEVLGIFLNHSVFTSSISLHQLLFSSQFTKFCSSYLLYLCDVLEADYFLFGTILYMIL